MSNTLFVKSLSLTASQLEQLYSLLQKEHGAMFLDSASSDHKNSNVSIFVWEPSFTIETVNQHTFVYRGDELISKVSTDPLEQVQLCLDSLTVIDSELPFTGGAVGYWDYELGGHFETLPNPKTSDINMPNMFIGIYASAIVVDHQNKQIHFVSQDEQAPQKWIQLEIQINNLSQQTELNFKLTTPWLSNMTKVEYAEKFQQVQQHLLSGDCYQINLAQRFSAGYSGSEYGSEWTAYNKLRKQNSAPFSSFIRHKNGAVLSVSPERFIEVKNNIIETKPIKGTRPRHADKAKDIELAKQLQNATKDRAENLMIVDLLRNDLSKVAVPGTVDVPELFEIESFPAVHHLVSKVTATLDPQFSALDVLRGAFPGGSITGAPKIRAMEIIHQLEPNPRSVYCGAIGYVKPNGDMDSNISIRTLVCNQNKIHCWAGGGLVADSVCDEEYQETLDKVNKILPILESA
ncbi:aminodeoxychorismate synthase component I [Psychrosphaera sp. F3M07]|uniref:aminodeoxychorismate synthase component I n=1 Tax=Psychrosphaera sp. F3M07 TaxID=2841560 RepID=UPI001C09A19B|nr:aminodeoxychorismate synthase component I [Psychrosphaera sp. F3M07]MBU2916545.1 aminodeoxychorismate synthase component I [Psychrosphaera sp. F3M07]